MLLLSPVIEASSNKGMVPVEGATQPQPTTQHRATLEQSPGKEMSGATAPTHSVRRFPPRHSIPSYRSARKDSFTPVGFDDLAAEVGLSAKFTRGEKLLRAAPPALHFVRRRLA